MKLENKRDISKCQGTKTSNLLHMYSGKRMKFIDYTLTQDEIIKFKVG